MTRFQIPGTLLIAVLLMVAASSAFAIDLGGHDRDGTVIGLTLGHGWNSVQFTYADINGDMKAMDTGNVSAFTGGFRVGWASSDYFIASIGMYGWRKSYYTYLYTSTRATNYHFVLEGYFFPRGEGFWIKGGIGRGTMDFNATAINPKDSIIFNESGWTLSTGAGYEFRISDGAAIGISYDFLYLPVGDFGTITDVSSTSHNLSLNIHFYM
jgi:hypothetical protein